MSPSTHREYTSITSVAPREQRQGKETGKHDIERIISTHLNTGQLPHTLTQPRRARIEPRIRRTRYVRDFMAQDGRVDGLAERDADRAAESSTAHNVSSVGQL